MRFNMPNVSAFDANGNPATGWTLNFYDPGTTTPKDVYSDAALTTPISQPIAANSAGVWTTIYMDASLYRVILKDANGTTKQDNDNYDPGLAAGFGLSSVVGVPQGGTGAGNAAAARANLGAASSDALTATQNDVTALQTAVATGVNEDGEFGALASKDSVARTDLATSFGVVVAQAVDATPYTSNAQLSSKIPQDDTTPLVSEGTQILTANITPASSSNKVRLKVSGFGYSTGTGSSIIVAVFRGSTCIYADNRGANSEFSSIGLDIIDSPASTAQQTYSVRIGATGVGNVYMNGDNSSRYFGGVAACNMRLEELEVH
jgi:hypothetical protein